MTTKRLIRFSSGPLAGQFRFVTTRSGCVTGPTTPGAPDNPAFVKFDLPFTDEEKAETVGYPESSASEPTGPTSLTCAEKQTKADAAAQSRAAAVLPTVPDPTLDAGDIERIRQFRIDNPEDPIERVQKTARLILSAIGGMLLGGLPEDVPDVILWGRRPIDKPVFDDMLEVFP